MVGCFQHSLPPPSSFSQPDDYWFVLGLVLLPKNFEKMRILGEPCYNRGTMLPCWNAISGLRIDRCESDGTPTDSILNENLKFVLLGYSWQEDASKHTLFQLNSQPCIKSPHSSGYLEWGHRGTSCPLPQISSQLDHPLLWWAPRPITRRGVVLAPSILKSRELRRY